MVQLLNYVHVQLHIDKSQCKEFSVILLTDSFFSDRFSNGHMPLSADFPNDNLIQLEQIFQENLASRPHPCQFQESVLKYRSVIVLMKRTSELF